jgi:ABC-type oligopeptide transport system substrate-binding subunit
MIRRALGLLAGLGLLMSGCESAPPPVQFAAEQVLHLVAPSDVRTLDPAKIHHPSVDVSLARNVFGGLYRFRDDLVEEPDLAKSMPEISADGLTWTFHLRTDVRFSNGDTVKAADVLYSWNRVASLNGDEYPSAFIFEGVQGYAEVQSGRAQTLSGLRKSDDYTVVVTLIAPAGFWLVELGLWATAVIDQRVVAGKGEDTWWTTPEGLIGTGPFRMTSREKGKSLDFEPVENWWGGSTGRLKRIRVDVVADQAFAESRYRAGEFDIVGYTPTDDFRQVSDETINSYRTDNHLKGELHLRPWLDTSHLRFRAEGRLDTDADVQVRRALSLALDRTRLATICFGGAQCEPATGGLILKGLAGYLGDGSDLNAKQDISAALALLRAWDPAGTRRSVRIGTFPDFISLATEIQAEWQSVLGLTVSLDFGEIPTIRRKASEGLYDVTVGAFAADYDSPHNWFSNIDNQCHAAIVDPQFQSLVAAADKEQPDAAVGDYKKAGQLLADDAACPALVYQEAVQLIKPWVRGAGGNALYENYWKSISILKH